MIIGGRSKSQEEAVKRAALISQSIQLLETAEFPLQKKVAEALWAIARNGTEALTKFMMSEGCIKTLFDMLLCHDANVVNTYLNIMRNMLWQEHGAKIMGLADVNLAVQLIEQAEGKEKLEALKSHGHDRISGMTDLLEEFWE